MWAWVIGKVDKQIMAVDVLYLYKTLHTILSSWTERLGLYLNRVFVTRNK